MKSLKLISFLNDLELICGLLTCIAIVSTQLNGFSCCYLTLLILFSIEYLVGANYVYLTIIILFYTVYSFVHSQMVLSIWFRHTVKESQVM